MPPKNYIATTWRVSVKPRLRYSFFYDFFVSNGSLFRFCFVYYILCSRFVKCSDDQVVSAHEVLDSNPAEGGVELMTPALHCTESFIITPSSSRYDLNKLKETLSTNHHFLLRGLPSRVCESVSGSFIVSTAYKCTALIQSNFNGSNIFGTIENCSRHG